MTALLVWNQLGQFSVTAVCAVCSARRALARVCQPSNTLMAVLEVTVGATRRPGRKRRLIALSCVVMSIVLFMVSGTLAVNLAGGPSAVLRFVAQGIRIHSWTAPATFCSWVSCC